MRVLISADMEGATGVTCPDDCEPGHPRWEYHRKLFTSDVNAAIAGFAEAGADEILVNEAHADQRNLLLEQLDSRASLLIGNHKPLGMMEGIDLHPDAVAFLGYHTGAGELGVLAHTYLPNTITSVHINGKVCSEGRMNALLAAEYGVPVALVTGDDLTGVDAKLYAPESVTVSVKTCIDRYAAICQHPKVTFAKIQQGAYESITNLSSSPVATAEEYTYDVAFDAAHLPVLVTHIPGVERTGNLSVRFTMPTMYEAIRCFRALTRVASSAIEPHYG